MKPPRKSALLRALARTWTPFEQTKITDEMRERHPLLKHCYQIWANSRFEVDMFACDSSIGGVMQCAIMRHGNIEPVTNDEVRRIVFELFGLEVEAVEIHRPMDDVVRPRVVWVLPSTWKLPFGIHMPSAWGNNASD